MKKILLVILLIVSLFIISKIDVRAEVFKTNKRFEPTVSYLDQKGDYASCNGLFSPDGLALIKEILGMVRIIAPILLIILVAVDFGTAVISNDNDALSKAGKKIVPRMIGVALLFFVPTIIRAILGIDGLQDILVGDDPLCHVMESKETTNEYNYI